VGVGAVAKSQNPNSIVNFVNVKWGEGTDGHGIVFTIRGTKKEASFLASDITLQVEGDSFWQAVGSGGGAALVTLAKWSFLPLSLCPKYMTPNSFIKGEESFKFTIGIGTKQNGTFGAQHITITNKLNDLIKAGDPSFDLVFEGDGRLLFGIRTSCSKLLECLNSKSINFPLLFSSTYTDENKKETKVSASNTDTKENSKQLGQTSSSSNSD